MSGPIDPSPRPAEPPTALEIVTVGRRAGLGVSMGAALLVAILPAVFVLFLASLAAVNAIGAEALEHTGGLDPATFGHAYRDAIALNVLVLGWALVRWVRGWFGEARPVWRPLMVLALFYVGGAAALVPVDLSGALDVPDVVTTATILGCLELWQYALPVVVLRSLSTATAATWRHGIGSVAAARRLTGAATIFALSGASLGAATIYGGSIGYLGDVGELFELPTARVGFFETVRRGMADVALELTAPDVPDPQLTSNPDDARFQRCATELATPRAAQDSAFDEAARVLRRRFSLQPADAEDVAARVLLSVCRLYAQREVDRLREYYLGAVIRRESNRFWRDQHRRREVLGPDGTLGYVDRPDEGPDPVELEAALDALSDLRDGDQQIIRLVLLEGWPHRETAKLLGITEGASRKRLHDAIRRLRIAFNQRMSSHGSESR